MEPVTSLDDKRRQVQDDLGRALRLWNAGKYEWEKVAEQRLADRDLSMADVAHVLIEGRVRSRERVGERTLCEIVGLGIDKQVIRLTIALGEDFLIFEALN